MPDHLNHQKGKHLIITVKVRVRRIKCHTVVVHSRNLVNAIGGSSVGLAIFCLIIVMVWALKRREVQLKIKLV